MPEILTANESCEKTPLVFAIGLPGRAGDRGEKNYAIVYLVLIASNKVKTLVAVSVKQVARKRFTGVL